MSVDSTDMGWARGDAVREESGRVPFRWQIFMGCVGVRQHHHPQTLPVIALDGGRLLSLNRVWRGDVAHKFGLPIARRFVPAQIVLAAINAVSAAVTAFNVGITPDGYTESMRSMVTAFVAIFSALFAFVGWFQQHPELDHGEPALAPVASRESNDESTA